MAKEIRNQVIDGRLVDASYPNESANQPATNTQRSCYPYEGRWAPYKGFWAMVFNIKR